MSSQKPPLPVAPSGPTPAPAKPAPVAALGDQGPSGTTLTPGEHKEGDNEGHARALSELTPPASCPAGGPLVVGGPVSSGTREPAEDPFVGARLSTPARGVASGDRQGSVFSPREDRLGAAITPKNAQGLLPPQACIFVANLSNQRTDEQLEFAVEQAFATFGTCYVKIRRDKNRMPYAFVQFENADDARLATANGKGLIIDERPIRIEPARAQRTAYLTSLTGESISENQAREVLDSYGSIEKCTVFTQAEREANGLPEVILVKFAYVQDCRDAVTAFAKDEHFRLFFLQHDEIRPRMHLPGPPQHHQGRVADLCSVFVGNLPDTTTEDQIHRVFGAFGKVISANVRSKAIGNTGKRNTFAFVAFETQEQAKAAIESSITMDGWQIRVEQKQYTLRRNFQSGYARPGFAPSPDSILQDLYFQGLSLGLPPAQASQILRVGHAGNPYAAGILPHMMQMIHTQQQPTVYFPNGPPQVANQHPGQPQHYAPYGPFFVPPEN